MYVTWHYTKQKNRNISPMLRHQFRGMNAGVLILKCSWRTDSVFMGKLHLAVGLAISSLLVSLQINTNFYNPEHFYLPLFLTSLVAPILLLSLSTYRAFMLRKFSDLYFCRTSKKIIYRQFRKTAYLDWNRVEGGIYSYTVFAGKYSITQYALAFAERHPDGSICLRDSFWIDSNEPANPSANYVAEVWEYIRHFMEEGPEKLPLPETSWFLSPLHHAFLTPKQAWRHYVPWRIGEPGELQGKKTWMLPFWLVLFPYNIILALSWYGLCRLCGVPQFSPIPPQVTGAPTHTQVRPL